jgi:hypothetical protein
MYNKGWLKPLKISQDKKELLEKAKLLPDGTEWLIARSCEMGVVKQAAIKKKISISKHESPDSSIIDEYIDELEEAKDNYPNKYWAVDRVSKEQATNATVITTEDGGIIVKKDGDIKGLFKKPSSNAKRISNDLIPAAILNGGIKLDCFDGYITDIYKEHGFRVVARMPFVEKYAPEGWNKDKHGTPGVVAMLYDPDKKITISIKVFTDYEEALFYRDSYIFYLLHE